MTNAAIALELPPKVSAVIWRRLALLSLGAQALAQTAAVIGREFTFALLARASGHDEAIVVQGLDELIATWHAQDVAGARQSLTDAMNHAVAFGYL